MHLTKTFLLEIYYKCDEKHYMHYLIQMPEILNNTAF